MGENNTISNMFTTVFNLRFSQLNGVEPATTSHLEEIEAEAQCCWRRHLDSNPDPPDAVPSVPGFTGTCRRTQGIISVIIVDVNHPLNFLS